MLTDSNLTILISPFFFFSSCLFACYHRARFKIILTGTPVQNNLSETYALLHYMVPTIFDLDCGDAFADSFSLNNTNSNSKNRAASASGGGSNGAVQVSIFFLDLRSYILRCFFFSSNQPCLDMFVFL